MFRLACILVLGLLPSTVAAQDAESKPILSDEDAFVWTWRHRITGQYTGTLAGKDDEWNARPKHWVHDIWSGWRLEPDQDWEFFMRYNLAGLKRRGLWRAKHPNEPPLEDQTWDYRKRWLERGAK